MSSINIYQPNHCSVLLAHHSYMASSRAAPAEIFRQNLQALINKTGIRPAEIERRCGVSGRMIGYILKGERKPTIDTAEDIARAFGLTGWQMLLPDLINDLSNTKQLDLLVHRYLQSSEDSRDYIMRVAEKEAGYGK